MDKKKEKNKNLGSFLLRYKYSIAILLFFTLANNGSALVIPRLASSIIDSYTTNTFNQQDVIAIFVPIATLIFLFAIIQTALSMVVAEKIGRDLRESIINRVSKQTYTFVNKITPERILTNITSDVNVLKEFISQGVVLIFTAIVLLIGSCIALLSINAQLAIPIILALPVLFFVFMFIFSKINKFFEIAQKNIDKLNQVIGETVVGASLIRVLNSRKEEEGKFRDINSYSRETGIKILTLFATLLPIITFLANLIVLFILFRGGNQVIDGELSYGELIAFNTYVDLLITPIFIIGFVSGTIFRAFTSFGRISEVINSKVDGDNGDIDIKINGDIEMKDVELKIEDKVLLKNINIKIKSNTRTAIIGPTGSGKTQLFNLITGLLKPTQGKIYIDGKEIEKYKSETLFNQIGLVFQDSIIFNTTILENLNFGDKYNEEDIEKALKTAEIYDFVQTLPEKLQTKITERGSNLSGGQKQRLTLARALILNPKILLLDDFTARVDRKTEMSILKNLNENYPETTIIMVSQKIEPVKDFDQVILLMDGEILASGKHKELLEKSVEYKLIFDSQQTTNNE